MTIANPGNSSSAELPAQVTPAERTAGTLTDQRMFSPEDIAVMAGIHGPGGTPAAASVTSTPAGNLSSTNVQAALNELDSEKIATTAIGVTVQGYSAVLAATTEAFTVADGTKLDGIEAGATADQTDAEIETAYNNQVAIMPQAEAEAGTATTSRRISAVRIAQAIAAQALQPAAIGVTVQGYSAVLAATTEAFTVADGTKLDGIEAGATADQTDAEIETAYNNQVVVMSQAEAEARTATTARRINALRLGQSIVAAMAAGPTIVDAALNGAIRSARGTITGVDIECDSGTEFAYTLASGTFTPTLSGIPASPNVYRMCLKVTYTGGSIVYTNFTGLTWHGGAAPTLTTGRTYFLKFETDNGGTTWFGWLDGENY